MGVQTRLEQRHFITVQGRYRRLNGVSRDVPISDISASGCRFFDRFGQMEPGTRVSVKIGPIGPIASIVRWCEQSTVGVQFENPLYDAVLDHIRDHMDERALAPHLRLAS